MVTHLEYFGKKSGEQKFPAKFKYAIGGHAIIYCRQERGYSSRDIKGEEFHAVHAIPNRASKIQQKAWKPAAQGSLTLNVDAAFLPEQHQGGIGGVLRDCQGRFIATFARPIPYTASPKQCEMLAIREGLDMLLSLQQKNVVLQSDSAEAITEIQSHDHSWLANGGLIDDIKQVWHQLEGIQLLHTPRSCNGVAHRLAVIGFEAVHASVWLYQALACLLDVLQHDCNKLN
ncbi:uncharacterized protein LOC112166687 [Rosa chinensis]|uniref:uncharacterized protein LOC112166687 n=1 Tax=Rosa chinensis TaxID=74649 RepID=UPI000D09453D|nr:uncharacterized protein LOC112166687 [Rosa chinensis]